MFSIIESFRSALQSIRAHSFRSFLTSLGIIIGVASVIAVVSIVQGLSASISNEFKGLGSNSLTVRADTPMEEIMQGKVNVLSMADYEKVVAHIDDISNVSPSFMPFGDFGTTVRHTGQSASGCSVTDTSPWPCTTIRESNSAKVFRSSDVSTANNSSWATTASSLAATTVRRPFSVR